MRIHAGQGVLTPAGVCVLLSTAMCIRPGGVLWAAPPCSSWVWISRSSTGRGEQIHGSGSETVTAQNALVERLVLALEICASRGVAWIIEQPSSSLMWEYPAMRACLQRHAAAEVRLDMGAYGADSPKPTTLMGTAPYLRVLHRRCSGPERIQLNHEGVETATSWTDAQGNKRCQGTKALKLTQQYPEGFGAAHALAFQQHYRGLEPAGAASRAEPAGSALQAAKRPRRSFDSYLNRVELVNGVVAALPDEVRSGCRDAWWLRDLTGRRWHSGLAEECKVEELD